MSYESINQELSSVKESYSDDNIAERLKDEGCPSDEITYNIPVFRLLIETNALAFSEIKYPFLNNKFNLDFNVIELLMNYNISFGQVQFVIHNDKSGGPPTQASARYSLSEYIILLHNESNNINCKSPCYAWDILYGDIIVGIGWWFEFKNVCCCDPVWNYYVIPQLSYKHLASDIN